jgi:hypothetical protein
LVGGSSGNHSEKWKLKLLPRRVTDNPSVKLPTDPCASPSASSSGPSSASSSPRSVPCTTSPFLRMRPSGVRTDPTHGLSGAKRVTDSSICQSTCFSSSFLWVSSRTLPLISLRPLRKSVITKRYLGLAERPRSHADLSASLKAPSSWPPLFPACPFSLRSTESSTCKLGIGVRHRIPS